jgi:hypothetical protein
MEALSPSCAYSKVFSIIGSGNTVVIYFFQFILKVPFVISVFEPESDMDDNEKMISKLIERRKMENDAFMKLLNAIDEQRIVIEKLTRCSIRKLGDNDTNEFKTNN